MKPKSFSPYYQYGYMLLDQGNYELAIPYLENVYQLESNRNFLNNIGISYYQLKDFQKARDFFRSSCTELDIENKSSYNLAISEISCQNISNARSITDQLFGNIQTTSHFEISGYEVGVLYFLLEDYEMAYACILKQGINGVDLFAWNELSHSLFITNKRLGNRPSRKKL